jgi:ATP-dependent helicase/nuclease subunit A
MIELTENQNAALARDKDIAVTAGAGTGKTLILVERYIDILIKHDVDIRELLAITFTNKAAAEMLSRVALRIDTLLADSDEGENHAKLLKLRNHLSSAYISTIHSFCSRLLREYPMEAGGLDPGFNTLNKIQSDFIVEECIDAEIARVDTNDPQWLDLFRNFHPDSIKSMLRMSLEHRFEMGEITARYHQSDTEHLYQELEEDFFDHVNNAFSATQLEELKKIIIDILDQNELSANNSTEKAKIITGLENFNDSGTHETIDFWIHLFALARLMTKNDGNAYKNLAQLGGQSVWTTSQKELLIDLSNSLSTLAIWMNENISSCPGPLEMTILSNLRKFYELYKNVESRYRLIKTNQDAIDFDDQQLLAYHLLKDNDQIRQQVAKRFKYIMVDEFQDTNLLQWKIIELISEHYENNVFIVGDPKQSIYGFRNADVRVFNSVKSKLATENSNGDLVLNESFRFKKAISNFVNLIFPNILQLDPSNLWEVDYHKVATKRLDADNGKVELALLNKTNDENVQAKFIASHILSLLSESEYNTGDISIMLRSRTHLAEIENTLREYGIPFQTIGGIGFYQGQEIYDTYHLLKFLMNPSDDLALIGLLRSPFANITDEGIFFLAGYEPGLSYWQKLNHLAEIEHLPQEDLNKLEMFFINATKWIDKRDRIGYFELLSEIFNESFYRAIISSDFKGDQIIANIDKILNIVLDYEKGRFSSMVDFAESLNRLINTYQKEGEAFLEFEQDNSVKIMTIHQAKGLEYPVVYLPYLNQKMNTGGGPTVFFDDHWGVVSNVNDLLLKSQKPLQSSYYLYDTQKLRNKRKEIAELKRLFYVGCTRAQDHLVLCGEVNKNKIPSETPLSWLIESLKLEPESLPEEQIDLSPDLSIQIHRSWPATDSVQERERKKTIQSLDQLKSLVPMEDELKTDPDFLKKSTDKPEGEIFSATQLMTFIEDKGEYHKRYHLGFFEDDYEKLGIAETGETDALLRGVLLHKLMESYPTININQLLDEVDISDDQKRERLLKELTSLVQQIDRSGAIKSSLNAVEYKNEVGIIKQLGSDFMTGTLDRIYKNEKNEWVVLDYKTNHITPRDVPRSAERYRVQLETYALLIGSVYPDQGTYPIYLYFIYPDVLHTEVYDKSQLVLIEKKFEKVIEEVKMFYPYTDIPVEP